MRIWCVCCVNASWIHVAGWGAFTFLSDQIFVWWIIKWHLKKVHQIFFPKYTILIIELTMKEWFMIYVYNNFFLLHVYFSLQNATRQIFCETADFSCKLSLIIWLHPINNQRIEPLWSGSHFESTIRKKNLICCCFCYILMEFITMLQNAIDTWRWASWQHYLEFPSSLIKQQFSEENAKMKFQFIIPIHSCSWVWKL